MANERSTVTPGLRRLGGATAVACFAVAGPSADARIPVPESALGPLIAVALAGVAVWVGGVNGLAACLAVGLGYGVEQAAGPSGLTRLCYYAGGLLLARVLFSDAKLMILGIIGLIVESYRFFEWVATATSLPRPFPMALFVLSVPVVGYGSLALFLRDRRTPSVGTADTDG